MTTNVYFKGITDLASLKAEYKKLVVSMHPDKGGDVAEFQNMQNEYNSLAEQLGGKGVVTDGLRGDSYSYGGFTYDYSDEIRNKVTDAKKDITSIVAAYRRELSAAVRDMEYLYNSDGVASVVSGGLLSVRSELDFLAKVCNVRGVSDFFNEGFIKDCYEKKSFLLSDGTQVDNILCEKRYVTDKTDIAKLVARCQARGLEVADLPLYIQKPAREGGKEKVYYYMPILNFSVSNVLKHLLDNTYKVKYATFKRAKATAAKKARKAKQKANKENK